jgi:hypothetical protein
MEPLALRFPADSTALADVRRSVRAWLEGLEIAAADVAAIVTACSDVVADAADGTSADGHEIELTGMLAGADVVVRCTGSPEWRIEEHSSRYVAALLVDDVAIERNGDGTSVTLRKAFDFGLRERRNL